MNPSQHRWPWRVDDENPAVSSLYFSSLVIDHARIDSGIGGSG